MLFWQQSQSGSSLNAPRICLGKLSSPDINVYLLILDVFPLSIVSPDDSSDH